MHSCVTSKNVKWCHLIWLTLYMFLVCLQPDLSLVVCSCSMEFQGISGWRQHLQSPVALSEKVKPGMFDGCLCRCAIQVTDKLWVLGLHRDQFRWRGLAGSGRFSNTSSFHDHRRMRLNRSLLGHRSWVGYPPQSWPVSQIHHVLGNISASLLFQRSSTLQLLSLTWNEPEEAKHLCLCRWPALFRDLR